MYEKARTDYTKAITLDPKCFDAYIGRSDVYWQQGLNDKAISNDSKYFPPYCNIGYTYLQQNKLDNAIKYFQKCLDHFENFIDANLDMAIVYYIMGNRSEAKTYLDKAKTIEPRISEVFDGISKLENGGHNWTERDKLTLKKMFDELN